VSQSLKD
jgi:hypothetical protein